MRVNCGRLPWHGACDGTWSFVNLRDEIKWEKRTKRPMIDLSESPFFHATFKADDFVWQWACFDKRLMLSGAGSFQTHEPSTTRINASTYQRIWKPICSRYSDEVLFNAWHKFLHCVWTKAPIPFNIKERHIILWKILFILIVFS